MSSFSVSYLVLCLVRVYFVPTQLEPDHDLTYSSYTNACLWTVEIQMCSHVSLSLNVNDRTNKRSKSKATLLSLQCFYQSVMSLAPRGRQLEQLKLYCRVKHWIPDICILWCLVKFNSPAYINGQWDPFCIACHKKINKTSYLKAKYAL